MQHATYIGVFSDLGISVAKLAKPIAIVGCGRSGTQYMSLALQKAGLDVGHERMGKDGTVDASFGPRVDSSKFVVLHQVRRPIPVISYLPYALESSWRRVAHYVKLIEKPLLLRAMQFWIDWNLIAEKVARWTYRIEDIDTMWPKICKEIGIAADVAPINTVPRDQHTLAGKYHLATWAELEAIDKKTTNAVRALATRYGYTDDHLYDKE